MSSDSSSAPDYYPDPDVISDSDSGDEVIFSAILDAARVLVEHCKSSQPLTRRPHRQRDHVGAHERLMQDYFSPDATFDAEQFRRRFRITRQLFLRIVGDLERDYDFFQQRDDARGKPGYSPLQKCTTAIRQLAYRTMSDAMEEYLQMSETMAREALHTFCECITQLYHKKYLRKPTQADIQKIYEQGQYNRCDHDGTTVILEAAASFDLWIWHAFFGMPGANNDIAVINASPLFDRLVNGVGPDTSFSTNDVNYEYGYYLVDGIYPDWATLVHSFTCPTDDKRKFYKKKHESARKDIERAFGVLKKRWSIIRNPARILHMDKLRNVMYTCIILHNMILEDSGRAICQGEYDDAPDPMTTLNEDERFAILLKTRKKRNEFQSSSGFG
ncbi:uncharacterized protein LOC143621420 [Bidens hawaiensis]|uniref:uncharacterized protein LOC143621420 n=1 Tax=Bidens hawaiensis TaxID=980011 RepID=UPI00404AD83B